MEAVNRETVCLERTPFIGNSSSPFLPSVLVTGWQKLNLAMHISRPYDVGEGLLIFKKK